MRRDKVDENSMSTEKERKNDYKANVLQIILKYELIYLVKLTVFALIVRTVWISLYTDEVGNILTSTKDFIGCLTFTASTMIDCFVLAKSISLKIKGKINVFHLIFCVLMLAASAFLLLIFLNEIPINKTVISAANMISLFCCLSPILEMLYDTAVNIEIENKKNIS